MDYEHCYQVAVFDWTNLAPNQKAYPGLELLFAVPNGGDRDRVVAAKLKAEGVKAGIPDMILPVARSGYHGLFIELKIPKTALHEKSYLKPHQRACMEDLSAQGYLCVTCWGDEAVIKVLRWYLEDEFKPFGGERGKTLKDWSELTPTLAFKDNKNIEVII